MGLYESLKTSPKLETEGVWLDLGHTKIRVARAGGKNTKFIAAAEKIAREHKRTLEHMNEEQGRKLFSKIFAEIIVKDWLSLDNENGTLMEDGVPIEENEGPYEGDRFTRGIERPGGKIVEFSVENVLKTFDDLPDLLRIVKETAEDASLFRESLIKDIVGN